MRNREAKERLDITEDSFLVLGLLFLIVGLVQEDWALAVVGLALLAYALDKARGEDGRDDPDASSDADSTGES
jgi:type IV secretory pathway TrbD component